MPSVQMQLKVPSWLTIAQSVFVLPLSAINIIYNICYFFVVRLLVNHFPVTKRLEEGEEFALQK